MVDVVDEDGVGESIDTIERNSMHHVRIGGPLQVTLVVYKHSRFPKE